MRGLTRIHREANQLAFSYRRVFYPLFVLTIALSVAWTTWPLMPHALPKAHAIGPTPIQHIVFIVKENHSFDSYFGRFPGAHGATTGQVKVNKIDQTINLTPIIDQSPDYCHVRKCALKDYDKGAMDYFNSTGACVTSPYTCYQAATQDQIPNYWNLAGNYVLSDETYAPMFGPTFPNRLYSIAAGSGDTTDTSAVGLPTFPNGSPAGWGCDSKPGTLVQLYNNTHVFPCFDFSTLADEMDQAGVSWKYYAPSPGEGGYIFSAYDAINHIRNGPDWTKNVVSWKNFVTDAQSGNLPAFSWVVAPIKLSDHPPASVCLGENWTVQQINAVMQSSAWSSTAIFLTYDEWGGFYDHEAPVSIDPLGYGFRVPMTIISPYAHATSNPTNTHISHTQYELSSVLRFGEEVFNLPSLGRRDAVVNDMMDAFDFSQLWNPPDILNTRTCGSLKTVTMPEDD
jgi:phospholipase C